MSVAASGLAGAVFSPAKMGAEVERTAASMWVEVFMGEVAEGMDGLQLKDMDEWVHFIGQRLFS
jgi:hypothetical protein